jgi:hypothetical protein
MTMTISSRRFARWATVAIAALVAGSTLALAGPASAQSLGPGLPSDPQVRGYIGFCDQNGNNVVGGDIDTTPFVWKSVASQTPPSSYQGKGQNAALVIYQPRPDTEPYDWTGTSITAGTFYNSKKLPTVQATHGDESLASYMKDFPPKVDGLYVLRMEFGKANVGLYSQTYPSTTIQVTGKSWRVVKGGTVDCKAATGISQEQLTGVVTKKQLTPGQPPAGEQTVAANGAPHPLTQTSSAPSGTSSKGGSSGAVNGGHLSAPAGGKSSGSAAAAGASATDQSPVASDNVAGSTVSHKSSSWIVWVLLGVVVLLAAALGLVLRARRASPPSAN